MIRAHFVSMCLFCFNSAERLSSQADESTVTDPCAGVPLSSLSQLETFEVDQVKPNEACSTCAICVQKWTIGELCTALPCRHIFHGGCIKQWLLLVRVLNFDDLSVVNDYR